MKSLGCPNKACLLASARSIICYGFYNTNSGKRRRYRCRSCGKSFCGNTGTPYHRLQHRRSTFDEVAALNVEGLNKSAIAPPTRISALQRSVSHRILAWCDQTRAPRGDASSSRQIEFGLKIYF